MTQHGKIVSLTKIDYDRSVKLRVPIRLASSIELQLIVTRSGPQVEFASVDSHRDVDCVIAVASHNLGPAADDRPVQVDTGSSAGA